MNSVGIDAWQPNKMLRNQQQFTNLRGTNMNKVIPSSYIDLSR